MSIIQFLLIGVIVFSGFKIYDYQQNLKETDRIEAESREVVKELKTEIAEAKKEPDDINIENISRDFVGELQKQYPEAVGHLEIENTRISYPVVQHEDNQYYLSHAPDQSVNANGSIFLDHRNNPRLDDDNNIIYGHYIKSGKIFHDLYKFRDQDFYEEGEVYEVQTADGPKTYRIFSVYDTDPSFQYRYVNYDDKGEKADFIDSIIDRSLIDAGEVDELKDENAKILTLSTCSNKGSTRLVVHGVEIENE